MILTSSQYSLYLWICTKKYLFLPLEEKIALSIFSPPSLGQVCDGISLLLSDHRSDKMLSAFFVFMQVIPVIIWVLASQLPSYIIGLVHLKQKDFSDQQEPQQKSLSWFRIILAPITEESSHKRVPTPFWEGSVSIVNFKYFGKIVATCSYTKTCLLYYRTAFDLNICIICYL